MIDLFAQSRALFEKYAAFDGNTDEIRKAGYPLHALQVDLARWQVHNFGCCDAREMALGICEEVGEFARSTRLCDSIDSIDAVGDIAIFASQLLTLNRLSISWIGGCVLASQNKSIEQVVSSAGLIAHTVLKRAQRIRRGVIDGIEQYRREIYHWARTLLFELSRFGIDISAAYVSTAVDVLKRDWKANPLTGKV